MPTQTYAPSLSRRVLIGVLSSLLLVATVAIARAQTVIPPQYIAKLYTEGLGRAPSQSEWADKVAYFQIHGCTAATLKTIGTAIYASTEFATDNPDSESKVIALYRGALNRDAENEGLAGYARAVDAGTPFTNIVNEIYTSKEFLGNVPAYCSGTSPGYGFSSQPAPTPALGRSGYRGSEEGLQSLLNRAAKGSTIYVAQKAVIPLTTTLRVPSRVTLATDGNPSRQHYTQMARLLRYRTFNGPNVMVDPGGSVTNMWIDGQRNVLGYSKPGGGTFDNANIATLGGSGTLIAQNRFTETQGGTNIFTAGSGSNYPCSSEAITNNLLTGYATLFGYKAPADGMSMQCENLDIESNDIVDMSDIGIVLFASPHVPQASKIRNNRIVSAGNSMNAPFSADPSTGNRGGQMLDFTGTEFQNNVFWTGPYTTFDFGIEAGAREYFHASENSDGKDPVYINNTTGILSARVHAGIAVAGMLDVTIQNDADHPLNFILVPFPPGKPSAKCPGGTVIAEKSIGHASGRFPAASVDQDFDGCI
jgi:Domain of unknown function (DUF4214)